MQAFRIQFVPLKTVISFFFQFRSNRGNAELSRLEFVASPATDFHNRSRKGDHFCASNNREELHENSRKENLIKC